GSNPATPTNKIKGFPALPLSIKTSLRTETGPKRKNPRHLPAAGRGNMQKMHRGQKAPFFAESAKKSGCYLRIMIGRRLRLSSRRRLLRQPEPPRDEAEHDIGNP